MTWSVGQIGVGRRIISGDVRSLVRLGGYWWTVEGGAPDVPFVTKRDDEGNAVGGFVASAVGGGGPTEGRVRGISTDGTDLFLVGYMSRVHKYRTDGTLLLQGPNSDDLLGDAWGLIAHDGSEVWAGAGDTRKIARFSASTGSYLSGTIFTAAHSLSDASWWNGNLYVANGSVFRKLAPPSPTVIQNFPTIPGLSCSGIWIEPDGEVWLSQDNVGFGRWGVLS